MPEVSVAAPRVALLARAGKAADSLADALRQAGAELLVVVDPAETDEVALRALDPQAVLVALEPSIEPALDRFDALLTDPGLTVIYDEAELAAHRAGWDAARWVRHLSAKLRRDSNVLPPGGEAEQEDLQPSPGAVPKPAAAFADFDFDALAREAAQLAGQVPVDGLPADAPPPVVPPQAPPVAPPPAAPAASMPPAAVSFADLSLAPVEPEPAPFAGAASPAAQDDMPAFDEVPKLDEVSTFDDAATEVSLESVDLEAVSFDADAFDSLQIESVSLESAPSDASGGIAPIRFDDDAFFLEELSVSSAPGDAPSAVEPAELGFDLDFNAPAAPAPAADEEVMSLEALFASSLEAARDVPEATQRTTLPAAETPAAPPAAPSFSFEDLSLAPEDAPAAPAEAPRAPARTHDLSALEARISGLSLVDIDTGPASGDGADAGIAGGDGAVVIEAGLGGPDPTRQLLAALPPEFPAVVLVRLHLQGGRYDRLVAQMQRAAALPVALAEAGAIASPGTIYFLPEGIDVHPGADGLAFIADPAPGAQLFAALAPGRSALVFLSGGAPHLVDAAMAASAAGALVLAQSPEDCYDGETCAELRRRGASAGLPAELAAKLASRWPSRSQA